MYPLLQATVLLFQNWLKNDSQFSESDSTWVSRLICESFKKWVNDSLTERVRYKPCLQTVLWILWKMVHTRHLFVNQKNQTLCHTLSLDHVWNVACSSKRTSSWRQDLSTPQGRLSPPKNSVNKVLSDRAFLSAASACSEMIAPEQAANHDRAAH